MRRVALSFKPLQITQVFTKDGTLDIRANCCGNVNDPWDFGSSSQYPALKADWKRTNVIPWEFGMEQTKSTLL